MSSTPAAAKEFPRKFVAADADLGKWPEVEAHMKRLEARQPASAEELERWILDWSELAACVDEERTRRYVAMTCATDDPAREKAYLDFVENVTPNCRPWWNKFQRKFLADPHRGGLPAARYAVFERSVRTEVDLFRQENVPLLTEDEKLKVEYQKISAAQKVRWDGEDRTLQQMALVLLEQDRARRQSAWELIQKRRMQDAEALEDLYDRMVALRHRIALNAGFANYRDYAFRDRGRFEYTPEDCAVFRESIAEVVLPAARGLIEARRKKLKLATLRPWDTQVDPDGLPALRPFKTSAELVERCKRIFDQVDPQMGARFRGMADAGRLDLDSRIGKAPGGYQEMFQESRHPFIFMNAVGTHRDLEVMLHEAGHAFHAYACRNDPLFWYRNPPLEFAEVASMGMELLAAPYLGEFYAAADRNRALREHLEGIILFLPHMATIDGFQHWVYTHPGHTRQERREHWLSLVRRFNLGDDWSGFEEIQGHSWKKQLHIYEVPFYYVEYGIAQLGALQVWGNSIRDYRKAVADYARGLALGGSRPLPELFAGAGIRFDFSKATIGPLMDSVLAELRTLEK